MGIRNIISHIQSALLLAGSAFCIYSCSGDRNDEEDDFEGLMTQRSEHLKIIESENGKLSYRFQAPLMETYEYDREPFREFRRGIKVETFSDSTGTVESTLVGDYAIHYLNRQLWEVKGNVVSTNANGQTLETQQLFWNQRTGRIYSNVDSKLTQGTDVIIGVGFESDEQFVDWEFRRPRGTVAVDVDTTRDGEDVEGEGEHSDEEGDAPVGENENGAPAENVQTPEPVSVNATQGDVSPTASRNTEQHTERNVMNTIEALNEIVPAETARETPAFIEATPQQ